METAGRFSLLASVVLYGLLTFLVAPTAANAERSRHRHVQNVKRHPDQTSSANQSRHRHHPLRRQIASIVLTKRQIKRALAQHLHRLYMAEKVMERQQMENKIAYRAHLARVAANRRERLAELNGDITSKSIRVWQAYVTSVPIRLISVDLNDPGVKVSALLARDGIGSAEPFSRMIRRSQPDVAVTGTFFSLDNLRPVGDIVIHGDLAYFGGMGTALCITHENQAEMVTVPWGHHHDWSTYDFVMACGPRLLEDGHIVLDPTAERFRDRHMLAPNSRIGVGITSSNKLVFVMTQKPIYLGRLAKIMRAEGCAQAMNLDAGTSTGFYCDGNMMARPGRWLTNIIVIHSGQHPTEHADAQVSSSPIHAS